MAPAGGRLVGMAGLYREDRVRTRHSGTVWGVYTAPGWRGLHIAEAIIDACLDWGRERGVVVAKLGVNTANTPAIRCYTRCGFTVYGVEPKSIFYNSQYYDELLMAKPLG
jgi:RimJ/RimL family protein N-acetyltransferase